MEDLGLKQNLNTSFWKNKKVLVTGHSGFKGSWLTLWLSKLEAKVVGVSLEPESNPNLFDIFEINNLCESKFCDIRNYQKFSSIVNKFKPSVIFHLAAQPIVSRSYVEPLNTFETNVIGTANICNIIKKSDFVECAVFITSDKVYKQSGDSFFKENDPLGGYDPYSASKAASEIICESYYQSFFKSKEISFATARAGNIIGGGDWSINRLVPDIIRAWHSGKSLEIRNPEFIRPWQHVIEATYSYLTLAQKIYHNKQLSGSYNFGPKEGITVKELIEFSNYSLEGLNYEISTKKQGFHEASLLTLNCEKSKNLLGIENKFSLSDTVRKTINWYKNYYENWDMKSTSIKEISAYMKLQNEI